MKFKIRITNMTVKEAFIQHETRALKKHWYIFVLITAPFLVAIPYLTPFLNSVNLLLRLIIFSAFLFSFVFAVIWFGYRFALKKTPMTDQERNAISYDIGNWPNEQRN